MLSQLFHNRIGLNRPVHQLLNLDLPVQEGFPRLLRDDPIPLKSLQDLGRETTSFYEFLQRCQRKEVDPFVHPALVPFVSSALARKDPAESLQEGVAPDCSRLQGSMPERHVSCRLRNHHPPLAVDGERHLLPGGQIPFDAPARANLEDHRVRSRPRLLNGEGPVAPSSGKDVLIVPIAAHRKEHGGIILKLLRLESHDSADPQRPLQAEGQVAGNPELVDHPGVGLPLHKDAVGPPKQIGDLSGHSIQRETVGPGAWQDPKPAALAFRLRLVLKEPAVKIGMGFQQGLGIRY